MPLENLNLLLRQQIIRQANKIQVTCSMKSSEETIYQEKYPHCMEFHDQPQNEVEDVSVDNTCEDLKTELLNIEVDESFAAEEHTLLCARFELLYNVIEHLLTTMDSTALQVKSDIRLSQSIQKLIHHDNCKNEGIFKSLQGFGQLHGLSIFDEVKPKLLTALNNYESLKKLCIERDDKQRKFKLALKNFKIILEIVNVNEESLPKLKHQFDEILLEYQQCRCLLHEELPFIINDSERVLGECAELLNNSFDALVERRLEVKNVFEELAKRFNQHEEFALVINDKIPIKSDDN